MGLLDTIKWWLYPSFPYAILEVVLPDRIERFYGGVDEISVISSRGSYVIMAVPRDSREDAPGPLTFKSSHDPWAVGVLTTPLNVFREKVLFWIGLWIMVWNIVFMIYSNLVFTPPYIVVNVPGIGPVRVPQPGWSPDPVAVAIGILLLGGLAYYIGLNFMRFRQTTIKHSVLMAIGSVNGMYYCVPAPEPLTVVKINDFLRILGYKMHHFELEGLEALAGALLPITRENRALREKALEYDDALSRMTQIDKMLERFHVTQYVARMMTAKPLLFLLLILLPFIIGFIVGLASSGGVTVEPAP